MECSNEIDQEMNRLEELYSTLNLLSPNSTSATKILNEILETKRKIGEDI